MMKVIRYTLIGVGACLSLWIIAMMALVGPATTILVLYSMVVIEPTMKKYGREHAETARVCAHGAKIMHVLEPLASDETFITYWKKNRADLESVAERIQFSWGPGANSLNLNETASLNSLPKHVARAQRAFDWRPRPYEVNDLTPHERTCLWSDTYDESCKDVLLAGIEFELSEDFAKSRTPAACAGKGKYVKTLLYFSHGEAPKIANNVVIGPSDKRFDKPRWKLLVKESLDRSQLNPLPDLNTDHEKPEASVRKLNDRWFIYVTIR
jgi:hypothetical protein